MCVVNRHHFQLSCTEWVRRSGSGCDGFSRSNREGVSHKFVRSAASLNWYEPPRLTSLFEGVEALYDESAERIRHPDYRIDLQLAITQEFGRTRL
jgi:hypothetical protein